MMRGTRVVAGVLETSHTDRNDGSRCQIHRAAAIGRHHRVSSASSDALIATKWMRFRARDVRSSHVGACADRNKLLRAQGVAPIFALSSTTRVNEGIE
jgi:hypothetical protein